MKGNRLYIIVILLGLIALPSLTRYEESGPDAISASLTPEYSFSEYAGKSQIPFEHSSYNVSSGATSYSLDISAKDYHKFINYPQAAVNDIYRSSAPYLSFAENILPHGITLSKLRRLNI